MTQSASPPAYPQPAQQPIPPQQYVQHRPPVDFLRPLASDFLLAIGVILGLFLMMIGSIIAGVADTQGVWEVGSGISAFGAFIAVAALFLGAIIRTNMERLVRFGFILAAALLVIGYGFWL